MKYRLNLGFLAEIWVFAGLWNYFSRNLDFSPVSGFFSGRFWFFGFWGIETDEGRKSAADRRNNRVGRFWIGSGRILRVGLVSDGFGQA